MKRLAMGAYAVALSGYASINLSPIPEDGLEVMYVAGDFPVEWHGRPGAPETRGNPSSAGET